MIDAAHANDELLDLTSGREAEGAFQEQAALCAVVEFEVEATIPFNVAERVSLPTARPHLEVVP